MSDLNDRADAILAAIDRFGAMLQHRGEFVDDHVEAIFTDVDDDTTNIEFKPKTEVGKVFCAEIEKIKMDTVQ
jgi:hypothetical protein